MQCSSLQDLELENVKNCITSLECLVLNIGKCTENENYVAKTMELSVTSRILKRHT